MELSWDDLGDQDNGFDIEIESSELDSDDLPDKLCDEDGNFDPFLLMDEYDEDGEEVMETEINSLDILFVSFNDNTFEINIT